MRKILLLALVITSNPTFAMSKSEICSFRARLVESFAYSRDNGKSEQQTLKETKAMFRKQFGPAAPDMKGYVQMVYQYKQFTPSQLKQVVEMSCLQE